MTAQLIAAKDQISDSRKEERRLARQAEVAARAAGEWEQRAMAAVRAGDDVVARDALLRKRQQELEYERLRAAEQDQHKRTATLTRALLTLNFRVEEAKHKRNDVVTRAERADALPALEREARDAEGVDADEMLKRLEAKMTDIETELELSDEAIANLAREAEDALRAQGELSRLKREASDPALPRALAVTRVPARKANPWPKRCPMRRADAYRPASGRTFWTRADETLIDAGRVAAAVAPPDEVAVRPPHAENVERLLERLGVDPVSGLSNDEVQARLRQYGPNRLAEAAAQERPFAAARPVRQSARADAARRRGHRRRAWG